MRKVQNIIHTFHPDTHAINQASVHELCIKQSKRKDLPRRDRKFHAYTNSPIYVATKMNSTPSERKQTRIATLQLQVQVAPEKNRPRQIHL